MPKAKTDMREIQDISAALCDWFTSQEISPCRATAAMGFLIGVMAAEGAGREEADRALTLVEAAMRSTARDVLKSRGK